MEIHYSALDTFILRSPLLPFDKFLEHLSELSDSEERFKSLFKDKEIQEAIYIGSPELFEEMNKYLNYGLSEKKEEERLKNSLIRYLSRMSTRCTPFGIFAGCSVGSLFDNTNIKLCQIASYRRHTRLDMHYLCELAQDLSKIPIIKHSLKYYSNNTIYRYGDRLRYIEFYYEKTIRINHLSAIKRSYYVDKVLKKASSGIEYEELINSLVDDELSFEVATDFVDQMIDSGVLLNELEPSVTGPEFIHQILNALKSLKNRSKVGNSILSIEEKIEKIIELLLEIDNNQIGNSPHLYEAIIAKIRELGSQYKLKYIFQTDMIKPVESASLSRDIIKDLKKTLALLTKMTCLVEDRQILNFYENFLERYEGKEMPLMQVLDNEIGIGFGQTVNAGDINPLIDDLIIPRPDINNQNLSWNKVQEVLLEKYSNALEMGLSTIEIKDKDFEFLQTNWDNIPPSISVICQILSDDENGREILLKSIGGTSAANLLGRFCHVDETIKKHVINIIQKEEDLISDEVYAEIVHLPAARIGNIQSRPVLRQLEIPVLTRSVVKKERQIELSDLMISVHNARITLRSKKLKKIIVPRLSTAHNFRSNTLPIYQFLCSIQTQKCRIGLGFTWGNFFDRFAWLPRVKYNNVILSSAKWLVKYHEIKSFFELQNDGSLLQLFNEWRKSRRMPRFVAFVDGDNEFFVDLENVLCLKSLFSVVKKRSSFHVKEFMFDCTRAIVKSEDGVFTNEVILAFYRN